MSLSENEIQQVAAELSDKLIGARIQRTIQPEPHVLLVTCRAQGENISLLADLSRDGCRFHRTQRRFTAPPEPPRFDRLLRKHLRGAQITGIGQPQGERIVRIDALLPVHGSDPQKRTLVLELFGKTANAFVLDQNGTLLDSLFPAKAAARGMRPRQTYIAPPSKAASLKSGRPGRIPADAQSANEYIDDLYAELLDRSAADTMRAELLRRINRQQKRTKAWRSKLQQELTRAQNADRLQREAEALLVHRAEIIKGAEHIEVPDHWNENAPPMRITLRSDLSPQQNIDRAFQRVRRLRAAARRLEHDLHKAESILDRLAQAGDALTDCQDHGIMAELAEGLERDGALPAPKRKRAAPAPAGPRRFKSADGIEILVGRNDRENDEITFRTARGNDLWLHTRDAPSSHVIVRLPGKSELPQETLVDAATLALHYSRLAKSESAEVIYARVKNLRKPKHAKPGKVLVTNEKSFLVRLEPSRLERLLRSAKKVQEK